jgi:hypothetical protein
MKKSIIIAIMFAGIGVSTPSFADYPGDYPDRPPAGYCDEGRARALEARIADDVRDGRVNWREGRDLHAKIDSVEGLQARYCRYGMNDWQARDLDQHYNRVADEIAVAENGRRAGWRDEWRDRW